MNSASGGMKKIPLEALSDRIPNVRAFWREALAMEPVVFPYENQIWEFDPTEAGTPIMAAFRKNPSWADLKRCRALYFGVYETSDTHGLSAKVLYLTGMDRAEPEFTNRTILWKPRWGRFRPPLFKLIARIEDGIDPSKKLKPPVKREEEVCGSIITVCDFNAANPDLEFVDVTPEQTQHLNYLVTLAAAVAIVKSALPGIPFEGPIWTGFDEGDIIRIR